MNPIKKSFIFISLLLMSACAPLPTMTPRSSSPATNKENKTTVSMASTPTPTPDISTQRFSSLAVIYIPHIEGDVEKLVNVLIEHPNLRLTLLFPPRYFEQADRRARLDTFRIFYASKQIEVGLTLDNEPILPLLADLKTGGDKSAKWGFSFSWPEDVAYQLARSSSKYQKRWGELPSGFYPPYLALSEQVVESIRRFRLNWTIGRRDATWGVKFFGGMALLIPDVQPTLEDMEEGSSAWTQALTKWTFAHPFVVVDASQWSDPNSERAFLRALAAAADEKHEIKLVTAQEFTEGLGDEHALPSNFKPFVFDYSKWISTNQQKKAWEALADARDVLEHYKNSGRANLQRLDAATEEMASAENGAFLFSLGENQTIQDNQERNFLATMANIYRLCNVPVPTDLNNLFAFKSYQKAAGKPTENDRPFFVEGAQSLTWNDPAGDDTGGGKVTPPSGRYPKGAFDLRELTINWNDSDVTFSVSVVGMPSLANSPVLPMLDIYIDINKFAGAGSTAPLRKRSGVSLEKEAAWEYAVTMTPSQSVLMQALPTGDPRMIKLQKANATGNTFFATFSRSVLRGDPRNWRLTVGLMGSENNRRAEELIPVPVLGTAGERNFGGASSGRTAPPFTDLLTISSEEQKRILSAYETGTKTALPYVEAQ